ncbi:hypothetical protein F0562_024996 [Nyssa sinensis]|uniref:non-specific serine/threonine protein kinase n=1 Tax=Nyssa sinensis TaxID=561372 RepID=A0A5J5BD93_9ASTE|nr:hypothetical protein F0562_024996 [Nyssa sinensis]
MSTMAMAWQDLWDDHCHTRIFSNVTCSTTLRTLNIFYNCNSTVLRGVRNNFTCSIDGLLEVGFYVDDLFFYAQLVDLPSCEVGIEVQVRRTILDRLGNGSLQLQEALKLGFEVSYNAYRASCSACEESDGICGSDSTSQQFVCFCHDGPYSDRFCGQRNSTIIILSIFLITLSLSHAQDNEPFGECRNTYSCGPNIQGIGYPFWGGAQPRLCGHPDFELKCQNNEYATIDMDTHTFRVLAIDRSTSTMAVARQDLWDDHCHTRIFSNFTLNDTLFGYPSTLRTLNIFYNCNFTVLREVRNNFTCSIDGLLEFGFYVDDSFLNAQLVEFSSCEVGIEVQVQRTSLDRLANGSLQLQEALKLGFEVSYNADRVSCSACEASDGICGSDSTSQQFVCFCRGGPNSDRFCGSRSANSNMPLKLTIGISAAGMGILLMCIVIFCTRSKTSSYKSLAFWKKKTNGDQNIETLIRQYGSMAVKRYNYSDVKKMTNFFKDKLGQGGNGGVYKGKLYDGHPVAVKILNASKGNGEEFINEVASISRTSHVNIVTLLGFCFEGSKRALIYEFMPNGSLEKFIYSKGPLKTERQLGWEKLYQISIGIARGLEYLHRGCNTRILHFDIKPHNVLLDKDFCPKISDFGLAKLCTGKESIISMSGTRGTIGYIAPELFNRNFGGVSHKSDVYSYGMMVLEMVGGRKNIDFGVDGTGDIDFPHWIYKHVELDEDLGLRGDTTKEENEIASKMILVGLWCIQTNPLRRPSMSKVMEMLEGSIETLEIPPRPYLCSPPRSIIDSSTTL